MNLCLKDRFLVSEPANQSRGNRIVTLSFIFIVGGTLMSLAFWLVLALVSGRAAADASSSPLQPSDAGAMQLVIDTDAGVDDAVAILTVLGDAIWGRRIVGITCVRGNTNTSQVAINVLKVLKIANRLEVPVFAGASEGLLFSPELQFFFGNDGMGDANYPIIPQPETLLQKQHAAVFLANVVKENPGNVTILAIGPMTNIALAMKLNPLFMNQVGQIIALAGVIQGTKYDSRPGVEFNVFMDPDAAWVVLEGAAKSQRNSSFFSILPAEIVLSSPIELSWRKNILGTINSTAVDFLNRIENKFLEGEIWPTFDIYAATILLGSQDIVTKKQDLHVDLEVAGRFTRGRLVVDYYNITGQPANVRLILGLNQKVVESLALSNLKK